MRIPIAWSRSLVARCSDSRGVHPLPSSTRHLHATSSILPPAPPALLHLMHSCTSRTSRTSRTSIMSTGPLHDAIADICLEADLYRTGEAADSPRPVSNTVLTSGNIKAAKAEFAAEEERRKEALKALQAEKERQEAARAQRQVSATAPWSKAVLYSHLLPSAPPRSFNFRSRKPVVLPPRLQAAKEARLAAKEEKARRKAEKEAAAREAAVREKEEKEANKAAIKAEREREKAEAFARCSGSSIPVAGAPGYTTAASTSTSSGPSGGGRRSAAARRAASVRPPATSTQPIGELQMEESELRDKLRPVYEAFDTDGSGGE